MSCAGAVFNKLRDFQRYGLTATGSAGNCAGTLNPADKPRLSAKSRFAGVNII